MAKRPRSPFDVGDEVCLRGVVRLLDVAGEGTVTIEIHATGQRVTVSATAGSIELVSKAPLGRRNPPL